VKGGGKMNLDRDGFIEKAVEEYSDMLYRIALNITHNPQDAFDVCQEVFVRLIKNRGKVKDENHLKPWLIRVAVNLAKSSVTTAERRRTLPLDEAKELNAEDDHFELLEIVRMLPEKYSTVIHLFYYEDMKIPEISRALGISQSAVKLRLSRGREKLRRILEKEN
jgi:RNA polymerase sigma-70 factor (ECF subfamily)